MTAALAALVLAGVGGGGGTVCICIGADGHVGLKAEPGACGDCCEGRPLPGESRHDRRAADPDGLRGAPHDCDCLDIAVSFARFDPVPVKRKSRHHQPTAAPIPGPPALVRAVDVRRRRPAPHAHSATSLLRSVVLLV